MGNQASSPEKTESRVAIPGAVDANLSNIKSILKDTSTEKALFTAAVGENQVHQSPKRLSRRGSVAPPALDEGAIDLMISEAGALTENSEVGESNGSVSSIDKAHNEPIVTNSNLDAQKDPISTDSNTKIENSLATQSPEAATSSEALLWAPVLTSNEIPSNNSSFIIDPVSKGKEDLDLVSKLKKKATTLFRKEDEGISLDGIIKNLLSHRGVKVQRRAVDIPKSHIEWVCRSCLEVVMSQPNLLEITGPVNVCGKLKNFNLIFRGCSWSV